ncbi:MAG: biopolymer transporter ExbD [Thermoguttaceae bacterium]|jgi:biopolymer transport protein ExbD
MPLKTNIDEEPTLNLTAMLDVMFLLIIFFMLGTRFVDDERKIGLSVPKVVDKGSLTSAPSRCVVNVYLDGTIALDGQPVNLEELTAKLSAAQRQHGDIGVLVRGDGSDRYQRMVSVLNACKQAGVKNLGISVRPVTAKK